MYQRLLGIVAVISSFGLSDPLPAGDVWKGSWKFEIDRQDQPALSYYDTRGRRIFGIACGAHFEMNAVYPGAAPKEETPGSITIGNGKTQMDFAGTGNCTNLQSRTFGFCHRKPLKEFMCELRKRIVARAHDYDSVSTTGRPDQHIAAGGAVGKSKGLSTATLDFENKITAADAAVDSTAKINRLGHDQNILIA